MPTWFATLHDGVHSFATTQVGPGRGAAIALTVAVIVLAAGQLRWSGMRQRRSH